MYKYSIDLLMRESKKCFLKLLKSKSKAACIKNENSSHACVFNYVFLKGGGAFKIIIFWQKTFILTFIGVTKRKFVFQQVYNIFYLDLYCLSLADTQLS